MATIPQAGKDRDWVACLRRVMRSAWFGEDVSGIEQPPAVLNGESLLGVNAAGTGYIPLIGVDGDRVTVAGSAIANGYKTVTFMTNRVGVASGRHFWISDGSYTVVSIQEIHAVAETTAATLVANINKLGAGSGGASVVVNATTFNLKATANTLQTSTVFTTSASIVAGDRLMWNTTGTSTELAGVAVSVLLAPGGRNNQVSGYFSGAFTTDNVFFIANHPVTVTRIDYVHAAAASGACTVMPKIDSGTQAPGAGTAILTTAFDCQAASNVAQTGTLAAGTRLNPGDRISADFIGTTTGLAGVVITVTLAPSEGRKEVVYHAQTNVNHVDAAFFIADRPYQVEFASAVWSTAAAAGNAQLTIDNGTQAPGAGLDLLSMDTNAGFQIDGTANTVEAGTFISAGRNFLQAGDRLSIDFSAATSIIGFVCTVTLRSA